MPHRSHLAEKPPICCQIAKVFNASCRTIRMSSMGPATTSLPPSSLADVYIARQPIFDVEQNVFAYELLFRSGDVEVANVDDGNSASSQVMINAFLEIGIESLVGNHSCFINLTRDFIVGQLPLPLPQETVVLEVLEDIDVDQELLDSLQVFSDKGYTIALDDYIFTDDKEPLFDIIDILKVDIMESDRNTLISEVARFKTKNIKLLAEKVETQEEFELCKKLGFHYFQGYFFSKPKILSTQTLQPNRISLMRMLATLQDPGCEVEDLEDLIKLDVSVSYKILRIINSALYNLQRDIDSIKQAIVILGLKTIRDWLTVITLTNLDDKPEELIQLCLQRARMLQQLATGAGFNSDTGFTIGLLSTLDALMDQPMEKIVTDLPLAVEVKEALLGEDGHLGSLLKQAISYERGEWQDTGVEPGEEKESMGAIYLDSIVWASDLCKQLSSN